MAGKCRFPGFQGSPAVPPRKSRTTPTVCAARLRLRRRRPPLWRTVIRQTHGLTHPGLDFRGEFRLFLQVVLYVLTPLPKAIAAIGKPGTALADDTVKFGDIQKTALSRNAFSEHQIELRLLERRGHLVFDNPDTDTVACDFLTLP